MRLTALFITAITVLLFVAAPYDADAQFTFATDNAGNSAYSDGWANGDNGGSGFGAWSLSTTGTAGFYTGNPSNISISGMSNPSWALYGNTGGAANAERSLSTAMGVGDTFSFQWGINYDTAAGNKGFSLFVGGTEVVNVNNGNSSAITFNGTGVGFGYGTTSMSWSFSYINPTTLSISANDRDGSGTFSTNITVSGGVTAFKYYISGNNNGGNAEPYYNNLLSTNSGVFSMGGTVTNANTFTGSGNLSIGANTTLALSGGGNNNYSGTTTISNGSTLRFQGSGTSGFGSAISGGGALVVSNGSAQLNLSNNNTGFDGAITVAAGSLEAWNAGALGSTVGNTTVQSGGTLRLWNTGGVNYAEALSLNGSGVGGNGALRNITNNNTWSGLITLGSASRISSDVGTLTLDVASGNAVSGSFDLTVGGAANTVINDNVNIGTAKLIKDGAGSLTLGAAMTYSGNTEINEGVLAIGSAGGLSSGSMVYLGNGGNNLNAAINFTGTGTIANAIQVNNTLANGAGSRTVTKMDGTSQTLSGQFTNNWATTFNVANSAGNLTLGNTVSGSGNIVKQGAGTLTSSGNNSSYSGGVYVDAGVLNFSGGALGSGALALGAEGGGASSAALNFGAANLTVSRNLEVRSGAARLVSYTPGSGSSTLGGNITLSNSLAFNVATGGTLRFTGLVTPQASGNVRLALDGGGTFVSTGNSTTTANNYQIRVGNGMLILGSGALTARTGVSGIGHGYDLGVDLNNNIVDATASILASNGVTVASSVYVSTTNNRARVLGLTNSGQATFSGGIDLYNAGLTLTADNSSGNAVIGGAIANFTGSTGASNSVTKTGAGTVTLSGNNSFGGTLTVEQGKLTIGAINNASADGVLGNSANAVVLGSSGQTGFLHYTGLTAASNKKFTAATGGTAGIEVSNAATTLTLSGVIDGSGGVQKGGAGVLTLSGNNTFSGALNIHAGTVQIASINNANSSGSLGQSSLAVGLGKSGTDNSATLQYTGSSSGSTTKTFSLDSQAGGVGIFQVDNAVALTLSGTISGTSKLEKSGAGTLVLAAGNTFNGALSVSAGVLSLDAASGSAAASVSSVSVASGATLLLSRSDQVLNSAAVSLSGGTIRRGGNVGEVFGNLSLTAASFLDFGAANSAGTLTFGTYTPSSLLTVQNFLPGNKLQFSSTLTSEQLNDPTKFSFSSGFTTGTESGYFTITAIPEPSTCLAAAALLAVLMWPSRRRLVKDAKSILGLRAPARDRLVG